MTEPTTGEQKTTDKTKLSEAVRIVQEDDSVSELTLDKFLTGLRLWIENERAFELTDAGRLDVCQIDAAAADAIIQYALFSDIVYG